MRIIGGSLKGRRLDPPLKKWPTRPTTDQAKEALFNILENDELTENLVISEVVGVDFVHVVLLLLDLSIDPTAENARWIRPPEGA